MLSSHPTVCGGGLAAAARRPAPVRSQPPRRARWPPGAHPLSPAAPARWSSTAHRTAAARTPGCCHERAAADRRHHLGGAGGQRRARSTPAGRAAATRDGARAALPARPRGGRRPAAGDAAAATTTRSSRCSTASTGICLSGGPDLDPAAYGAEPHPELGPIEPDLDRFELALAPPRRRPRDADPGDLPRHPGAQRRPRRHPAPAPARRLDGEIDHRQTTPGDRARATRSRSSPAASSPRRSAATADVPTSTPSTTRRSTGSARGCARWRQRPRRRDRGDRGPDRDFLLGVQWHAETLVHRPERRRCSARFVEACAARRRRVQRRSGARGRVSEGVAGDPAGLGGLGRAARARPPYTVGIEEEVMLLDPPSWALAHRIDSVLPRAARAAAPSLRPPRRTARRWSSQTGVHCDGRRGGRASWRRCAGARRRRWRALGCGRRAPAPTPSRSGRRSWSPTGERYQFVYGSMRELARREPTFALHVHVGVARPEDAIQRRQPPARPPAAAARALGQLALLAGPRHRPRLGAHAALPGLPAGRASRARSTTTPTTSRRSTC